MSGQQILTLFFKVVGAQNARLESAKESVVNSSSNYLEHPFQRQNLSGLYLHLDFYWSWMAMLNLLALRLNIMAHITTK